MGRFRFRLAAVLKVSRIKKDQAEVKFAEATQALALEQQKLARLHESLAEGTRNYEKLTEKKITVDMLVNYSSFFARLKSEIETQQTAVQIAEVHKAETLEILKVAMNKLKSIERLKERRLAEYMEEQLHEEQKQLDEIGLQLYTRAGR